MWRNVLVLLLAIILYCYTSDYYKIVETYSYSVNLPEKLDGPLKPNDRLDKVEKLYENELHWPEAFAVSGNQIYTGLGDGRIVQISGNKLTTICRTGKDCGGQHEEHICGRPLGMEFDKNGLLYVADAYHGLLKINVKTGEKVSVLSSDTVISGKRLTFLNDIALDEKENVIYLTQSTTKWNISTVLVGIIEHESSGRLLKLNLKTKEVSVLLDGLSFPNGIEFTHDRSGLLVAIGNKNKIFKYQLQGTLKGRFASLPLVLPGEPDNISKSKRGNYWVGIASARSLESPGFHNRFADKPLYRKIFLHVHRLLTAPFSAILSLVPHKQTKEIGFELKTGRILVETESVHGIIVEFDDKGNIVQTLQSPSGKVGLISEVLEHNGFLYLGSWRNKYVGRLKL